MTFLILRNSLAHTPRLVVLLAQGGLVGGELRREELEA